MARQTEDAASLLAPQQREPQQQQQQQRAVESASSSAAADGDSETPIAPVERDTRDASEGGCSLRPQNEAIANVGLYIAVPSDAAAAAEPGKRFEGRQIASARHVQPAWFIPLVRRLFGSEWARLWSAVASYGKFSPHPVYEHGARAAVAGRVLLLGDAAHMASPNTGSGARAAFADALALRHCLVQSFAAGGGGDASAKIDAALQAYNKDVVERGKQLLQLSQHVGQRYMPGTQEMLLVESLAKEAAREVAPSSD